MKYYKTNGIHIVESSVEDFKIEMCDTTKKNAAKTNYCNAGFFGGFVEGKVHFTLPSGNLVCDFTSTCALTKKYCTERGKFAGSKFTFDSSKWGYMNQFYGKSASALGIVNGKAEIEEIKGVAKSYSYLITGVPIMRDGADVKFATSVKNQGWDASTLYATWHIFLGLKEDKTTIYIMGMKTTSGNMITSAEAYKKFKALGFVDVIKLDGGGSFYMNVENKVVQSTLENRRINTIIVFDGKKETTTNPYPVPTRTLYKGRKGDDVKWMQYQLNYFGGSLDIDGCFGPGCYTAIKNFQTSHGLSPDGSCGPATRAKLKEV